MIKKIMISSAILGTLTFAHVNNELHGDIEKYEGDYIPEREMNAEMIVNDRIQTLQQNKVEFTQQELRELEKAPLR